MAQYPEYLIRARRESLLMTQEEVAERAGLSVRTIQRAEAGKRVHGLSSHRIALALGVRVEDLWPRRR